MAGINFITRVDEFAELPSEFPEMSKWRMIIDGDGYVVTELENQFRLEGNIPRGGGYIGVSFKPECGVISVGTPAFALSPALVEWGLDRIENEDNWFVRVDKEGLSEVDDQKRRELYRQTLDLPKSRHVGIEPIGSGQLAPRKSDVSRAKWITMTKFPFASGEFVPDDAAEKIRQAGYQAAYARPACGEELLGVVQKAAERKAEEIREKAREIRSWRRDSRRIEEVKEERDRSRSRVLNLENEVRELEKQINDLERKKRKLEQKLERERGSGKIGAIKALRDKLGVSLATAKQAVEELT